MVMTVAGEVIELHRVRSTPEVDQLKSIFISIVQVASYARDCTRVSLVRFEFGLPCSLPHCSTS